MKLFYCIAIFVGVAMFACHDVTEGYLETEDASYAEDSLVVRKTLDPEKDAIRIENGAPWVTLQMEGYLGTEPITFSIESVTSPGNEAGAAEFMKHLTIRGGGAMQYPQGTNVPAGRYVVSVRLTNPGYSQVVADCFTFIVE